MYAVNPPTTGVHHMEPCCTANINQQNIGEGNLYISESYVHWINNENKGICLEYPEMAVHAVSTDTSSFPEACVYIMYNKNVLNKSTNSSDSENENSDEYDISEVRFVPQNKEHIKKIFDAMSDCQCLHPDEEDSDYAEEGYMEGAEYFPDGAAGEGFYTGEEGMSHMTPQGIATMQRLEAMLGAQTDPASGDGLHEEVNNLNIDDHETNGVHEEGQFDDA